MRWGRVDNALAIAERTDLFSAMARVARLSNRWSATRCGRQNLA